MAEVFDRFLSPANAELMVMGDVDPAALRAAVLRTFGPVPRGVPHPDLPHSFGGQALALSSFRLVVQVKCAPFHAMSG